MSVSKIHHPDRLFPTDDTVRSIARTLYSSIEKLPIISPHGHTDPAWFALNGHFNNPLDLLITPDHYVLRMLYSQGIPLETFGVSRLGEQIDVDARDGWKVFAHQYHLFRGTPTYMWFNHVFSEIFGLDELLTGETADHFYDTIDAVLATEEFKPRALFEKFNIKFLATTESATDTLKFHAMINEDGWGGRVVTTYRPDNLTNPEHPDFQASLRLVSEQTGEDAYSWQGYLAAHRKRRKFFRKYGATATDHGHPTATTSDLSLSACEALFSKVVAGKFSPQDAEVFRGQMLTEMAAMSVNDGMTMQIHPGVYRNHNRRLFDAYGADKGADIPRATNYVEALHPLLNKFGEEKTLSLIIFTLDETSYSRELAPLAGHYPAMKLGPAWWFHDSPEGMMRFREQTTEVAGFYNAVGFNDDTRAFFSIPARHDMARRIDCSWLARLVAEHRMTIEEANDVALDLTLSLPMKAYNIGESRV